MAAFESDFFEEQFGCVEEFQTNVTAARVWSDGFTSAAAKLQLPIQYSMATPSNLLQSLHQPAVTNFRVSGDYANGGSWDIGWSSMLVWALGAAPSKDTFWTSNQSDVARTLAPECGAAGCPPDHSDAGCELHSMLAALSTGPVQPSDSVGRTRKELLLPSMRKDGLLLQPSKPLTVLDRLLDVAAGDTYPRGPVDTQCCREAQRESYYAKGGGAVTGGPCAWELCAPWGVTVLGTYSGSGPPAQPPNFEVLQRAWYFLAHSLASEPFPVKAADFWPPIHRTETNIELVYREWHQPQCEDGAAAESCTRRTTVNGSSATLFEVGDSSLPVFAPQLIAAVPTVDGFALLGELDKCASLSSQRFLKIDQGNGTLRVTISGSANEEVAVTCLVPDVHGNPAAVVSRQVLGFQTDGKQTAFFAAANHVRPTTKSFCDGWKLQFSDEFEAPDLNITSWRVTIGQDRGRTRTANGTADNVYVENGALVLRSRRSSDNSSALTTGAVDTFQKMAWGRDDGRTRVCVRAMLPGHGADKSDGLWPAIWMGPSNYSFSAGGVKNSEIDILEMVNGDGKGHSTYHWGSHPGPGPWSGDQQATLIKDYDTAYHEYAVEFGDDGVLFALDGSVVHPVAPSATTYDEDYYLILNTALGGSWPKPVSSRTVFPVYHRIDYVRIAVNADDEKEELAKLKK